MRIARALTALAYPADALRAMNLRTWEIATRTALENDPGTAALEAEFPGIRKAAIDAARPIARLGVDAFVTKMLERNAEIFAARLTPSEMRAAIEMYQVPAVQKMLLAVLEGVDIRPIAAAAVDSVASTGAPNIDPAAIKREERASMRRTAAKLTPAETIAIMRFEKAPWFPKLVAARTEIERETMQAVNAPDPAWIEKQQAAMRHAILAFADRPQAATQ
ncbi:hypothetical protein [Sphingosinicella sp. BN140058]|uniref:hypothetical protein n=1 Tax=Sphingosinicella sp. BN140058 TaxID=1892855 RepID=UPI00101326CF|nr:hypothetical protein [Sphingosinicella sp. BN140058]QAY77194.1 hypothetical protein ETR14_12325 [Sphingosinicella sp. BN140058]